MSSSGVSSSQRLFSGPMSDGLLDVPCGCVGAFARGVCTPAAPAGACPPPAFLFVCSRQAGAWPPAVCFKRSRPAGLFVAAHQQPSEGGRQKTPWGPKAGPWTEDDKRSGVSRHVASRRKVQFLTHRTIEILHTKHATLFDVVDSICRNGFYPASQRNA